eukprot:1160434-Pelagomonas_calceolata.AAC.7
MPQADFIQLKAHIKRGVGLSDWLYTALQSMFYTMERKGKMEVSNPVVQDVRMSTEPPAFGVCIREMSTAAQRVLGHM